MVVNMMSKDLSISVLMDFYSELLTDKQKDTLDLYYNQDYSLAEIAQHLEISRQGVRDFIKRGEKQLFDFEEALGMVKRFKDINNNINETEKLLLNMTSENFQNSKDEILKKLEYIKKSL